MKWRPLLSTVALSVGVNTGCGIGKHDLERGFRDPPAQARPHTWWHWMNGNVTREGITADLEAMKRIGLGGAQIFNVSEGIPEGSVGVMSPEWRAMVSHAVHEADRLGLELCMHNCAGWSSSGGPWITPEHAMQRVVTSETAVTGPAAFSELLPQPQSNKDYYRDIAVLAFPTPRNAALRIKDIGPKAGFEARYGQLPALDALPPDAVVEQNAIADLTGKLEADGKLKWDVPAGAWTILRIGYTPTGAVNAPSPESGRGLECDKLSRAGLDAHWAGMMGPLGGDLGPLMGSTLNNCLVDSYEVGGQNWTAQFRDEFLRRRGYDPLPFLPALTGRVIDSGERSERFLWDFRRTIADLFADNYYSYFAELCHKHGMRASIEPYDGPFDCLLSGRDADIPMGEFWVGGGESNSCKLAASVAHTYGRTIVGAESFTAVPQTGRWQNHPAALKSIGDLMYCVGINRYIIHRYAHQPWLDRVPGMTMGQWGTHFERTTTWWDHGGPEWVRYMARCQYLLQRGRFAADVCCFAGESAPNGAPYNPALKAKGYDYDACNADVLLNGSSVRDGRLVLRSGMSYRVLVLPDTPFMTPQLLSRIGELVQAGATVIGPKPDRSPSLSGYPDCDAKVRTLAQQIWGDCDGTSVKEHAYGKGKVIWGRLVEEALVGEHVDPDCSFSVGAAAPKMAWIHRVDGDTDIYFVSNQSLRQQVVECAFRTRGKVPELWYPETGKIETAPVWNTLERLETQPHDRAREHGVVVSIPFEPSGSVFVVFRRPIRQDDHLVAIHAPVEIEQRIATPKIEIIRARYEAVDGAGGSDVTAKVAAMVAAGETGIPASNGAFGDPTYMHVKRLVVEFKVDGVLQSGTANENDVLNLIAPPAGPTPLPPFVLATKAGATEITALHGGRYTFRTSTGRDDQLEVLAPPAPVEISGPWTLRFPPDRGAPAMVELDRLSSWTEHADAGVRYFSGTAEYETAFELPADYVAAWRALYLDLGEVGCIAEVTLNGENFDAWWKPPFAGDVTKAAEPGRNVLKVRVTNLWVNRLIGDEHYADDCEWNGITLKRWPQWLLDGTPRPSAERVTFTTWKHWKRGAKPLDSGLMGPVMLRPAVRMTIPK
ncbi:MAG: hypothetical protein HZB38_07365 [Planctomycetes bacterium]|nr:hypothetical protein [Planctomycetota bacterium]